MENKMSLAKMTKNVKLKLIEDAWNSYIGKRETRQMGTNAVNINPGRKQQTIFNVENLI
jgi:hypothetical protein